MMSARSPPRSAKRGDAKLDDISSPFSSPTKRSRINDADAAKTSTPPSRGRGRTPGTPHLVTPSSSRKQAGGLSRRTTSEGEEDAKPAARRLPFGRSASNASSDDGTSTASITTVIPAVKKVYSLVNKRTGSLGGNGAGGAIYGELTSGSMQKMVDLMKIHTDFEPKSRFIDVGSGLGKPNLHVAVDPGVEFSYGIEHEKVRWLLGMSNLDAVLQEASKQQGKPSSAADDKIGTNCMFAYADIMDAKTFDPFTHVYMFSIGFPPNLWIALSEMWNRSTSPYMICSHAPRHMIDEYDFDVELICQANTSMHGSTENHMGYLYKRGSKTSKKKGAAKAIAGLPKDVPCDPLFAGPWKLIRSGFSKHRNEVQKQFLENQETGRPKRTRNLAAKK